VRAWLNAELAKTGAERQAEHVLYEARLHREKRTERRRGLKHFALVLAVLSVALFLYDQGQLGIILIIWVPIGLLFVAQHFNLGATYK
jgi:ferric-dicitrate binding protein FerR (iron transport regulator)